MSAVDTQYEDLLKALVQEGRPLRPTRPGVRAVSLFHRSLHYDLSDGTIPVITTKKVHFKSVVVELLWMLKGLTNTQYLHEHGVSIWDEWADENGDLGPVYGRQWRMWNPQGQYVDQMAALVKGLRDDPYGRRHIVTAWNPTDLPDMALPPCHMFFQAYVENDGSLSLQVYQRSADTFLGVPFNIASYALLTHLLADYLGRPAGRLHWVGGDVHLYENHFPQAREQITREPYPFPRLVTVTQPGVPPWDLEPGDIGLTSYIHHGALPGDVAI